MTAFSSALSRVASLADRWHWVLLIVAAPFLLFPSPSNSPALLILPVVWIAGLAAKHEPFPRTPLNLALLALVVMLLVSEWATFDLMISLPKITGLVLGIAVFFAIVRVGKTSHGWWLSFLALLGVGVSFAAFGLIGTQWGAKIAALNFFAERLVLRIKGIPGIEEGLNPNQLAGALAWVLPVLVVFSGFVLANRQGLMKLYGRRVGMAVVVAAVFSTALVLFVFVLTESRSAYMGFVFGMYMVIWAVASGRWRRVLLIVPLIGLLGLAILQWQGALSGIGERLFGGDLTDSSARSLNTLAGRFKLWSRAIYGIQDFPLTGMGLNTFRKVVHVLYPLFTTEPAYDIGHAHSEYLQVALNLGDPRPCRVSRHLHRGLCYVCPDLADGWERRGGCRSERARFLVDWRSFAHADAGSWSGRRVVVPPGLRADRRVGARRETGHPVLDVTWPGNQSVPAREFRSVAGISQPQRLARPSP